MSNVIKKLPPNKFPKLLSEINDPPDELFLIGEMPPDDHIFLAVVGSRKFTSYGKQAAEQIISRLKGFPIVIVSGLAIGIDSIAHNAALNVGLTTIAIPGSGLNDDVLYPASNRSLAKKIVERGGALLSPFKPDFKATQWSFPARNRIMAGISQAVLIIEAEEKSGTLITARLALDYNRDVYAIPGSIFSPTSRGTNSLIGDGAMLVTKSEDILNALGFRIDDTTKKSQDSPPTDMSPEEKAVWKLLSSPLERDSLLRLMDMPVSKANGILSLMEIKEFIKEADGKIFRG
ncbi:MAG: DNA-protecting protein DprA [Candidatus Yonathbacteria bacterium]|nr:DNA-protecting protein DprA [Candidatus Yonathbacteria bacterium]